MQGTSTPSRDAANACHQQWSCQPPPRTVDDQVPRTPHAPPWQRLSARHPRHQWPSNSTSGQDAHVKLFIGSLTNDITTDELRSYFTRFGPVSDCIAMRWPDGGTRGFGYVTFLHPEGAASTLEKQQHMISGHRVDVKLAVPGTNKLFVGGLPQGTSIMDLRTYFTAFGRVSDAVIVTNPSTGCSRGFGFVVFPPGKEGDVIMETILHSSQIHRICTPTYPNGKRVSVKRASDRRGGKVGKYCNSDETAVRSAADHICIGQSPIIASSGCQKSLPHDSYTPSTDGTLDADSRTFVPSDEDASTRRSSFTPEVQEHSAIPIKVVSTLAAGDAHDVHQSDSCSHGLDIVLPGPPGLPGAPAETDQPSRYFAGFTKFSAVHNGGADALGANDVKFAGSEDLARSLEQLLVLESERRTFAHCNKDFAVGLPDGGIIQAAALGTN